MPLTAEQLAQVDPNPPEWLKQVRDNYQKQADIALMNARAGYTQTLAEWVSRNTANRSRGLPIDRPPLPPTSTTFYAARGGVLGGYIIQSDDPDGSVAPAVLPPPVDVKISPNVQLGTGAGEFNDLLLKKLDSIQDGITMLLLRR